MSFELTFFSPAKSLTFTVFAEGFPVEVPVSLPSDVREYWWEGEDLVFVIEHQTDEQKKAWLHTLIYLLELLEPINHKVKTGFIEQETSQEAIDFVASLIDWD